MSSLKRLQSIWSAFGLLAIVMPAFGGLTAPVSLLTLQERADLIVVGTVTATSGAPVGILSLRVERVIKGDAALSGVNLPLSWSSEPVTRAPSQARDAVVGPGLWYLQGSPNSWKLLPVLQGDVPLEMSNFPVPNTPVLPVYNYGSGASLSDKVASELGSAIEAAGGSYSFPLYALHGGLLDELHSPMVPLLYQRLSTSVFIQQRILGLSGFIRTGSGAAMAAAAELAPRIGAYPIESGILLSSIRDHFRTNDPSSVACLGQAATDSTDPNLAFRQAAAFALAAIHNAAALPYLATLLDDPNPRLRIEAIRGIGSFANGLPAQVADAVASLTHLQLTNPAPYRTKDTMSNFALGAGAIESREALYLAFWKQWWTTNRLTLGY